MNTASDQSFNVVLASVSGAGKSHFINKYLGIDKAKEGNKNNVNRTTNAVSMYQLGNINLYDSPGVYEVTCHTEELIKEYFQNIFKKINQIDYLIVVIPASNHGLRNVDLLTLLVLSEFSALKNRIIVYISKTDLVSNRSLLNGYFDKVKKQMPIKDCKIYVDEYSITPGIISLKSNELERIFETITSKNPNTITNSLEADNIIPWINKVQQNMIDNNLYPPNYVVNYNGGFLRRLFLSLVSDKAMPHYVPNNNKLITLTLFDSKGEVTSRLIKNRDVIRYNNGEIFYSGTFHGNNFDIGTFYDLNGEVLYEKKY